MQDKVPSFDWKDKATYEDRLVSEYLAPLDMACRQDGEAPIALQRQVVGDLQRYFATDQRERAPTVVVDEAMAQRFHDVIGRIMRFVSNSVVASLDPSLVSAEVKHALLSYKNLEAWSPVVVNAYDHDQGLVRLSYYIHGTKPQEEFFVDGRVIQPAFAKYRACNFFRRMLLRQRIAWLPVAAADSLSVHLDGRLAPITLDPEILFADDMLAADIHEPSMAEVRLAYSRGKGRRKQLPWNVAGLKARLLYWMAKMPWARQKFARAWVFIDRDIDADDNAEHLYRWVRKYHPEINAWFMLEKNVTDWSRLEAEGFRLMPPGLQRKMLILNCQNIISSHSDYEFGGFDPKYYSEFMTWRFSFVPHGISKDDVSHWLGRRCFDLFFTTSPQEYESIVSDDTPYAYTNREVKLTGFPRQDKLLELSLASCQTTPDVILIMPTWRGSLVDDRFSSMTKIQQIDHLCESKYFRYWREFVQSSRLLDLASKYKKRVIFMAHPNCVNYIEAFNIPTYISIATKANTRMLPLINDSLLLVTDYTSVAFEMANLRRLVLYYQFDKIEFYSGAHNWREGYFDYVRDGFGPISHTCDELLSNIEKYLESDNHIDETYLRRMIRAMPDRNGEVCRNVFEIISTAANLERPI